MRRCQVRYRPFLRPVFGAVLDWSDMLSVTVPTNLAVATLVKAEPAPIVVADRSPPPAAPTVSVQVSVQAPPPSYPTPPSSYPSAYTSPRKPAASPSPSYTNTYSNTTSSNTQPLRKGVHSGLLLLLLFLSNRCEAGTCQECHSDINGDMIVFGNRSFHPEHFICNKWFVPSCYL